MDSVYRRRNGYAYSERMDRELRFNRSAAAFVSLTPNRGYRTVKIRYLAFWLGANNFLENLLFGGGRDRHNKLVKQYGDKRILEEADRAIRAIRKGDLDPVDSINRGIDHMLSAGLSNNTVRIFRYTICRFLLYSRLGLEPYDLSRAVKNVPRVWAKYCPSGKTRSTSPRLLSRCISKPPSSSGTGSVS